DDREPLVVAAHRIRKHRHKMMCWEYGTADRWRKGDHGVMVVDPADVEEENVIRSALSDESHEARQVLPRPVAHNAVNCERDLVRPCIGSRRQYVHLEATLGQLQALMIGMVSLTGFHRRICGCNEENFHARYLLGSSRMRNQCWAWVLY